MKYRAMTFAFTACLVSSLAFAANPTDAPLMPRGGTHRCTAAELRGPQAWALKPEG
jgi:hypothetical protein